MAPHRLLRVAGVPDDLWLRHRDLLRAADRALGDHSVGRLDVLEEVLLEAPAALLAIVHHDFENVLGGGDIRCTCNDLDRGS